MGPQRIEAVAGHLFFRLNGPLRRGACCSTTRARYFSMLVLLVIRRETTIYPYVALIGQNIEKSIFMLNEFGYPGMVTTSLSTSTSSAPGRVYASTMCVHLLTHTR